MPAVKKGESRNDYVHRAIPEIKKDHPGMNLRQAVGMAEGMYTSKWHMKGGKKKK